MATRIPIDIDAEMACLGAMMMGGTASVEDAIATTSAAAFSRSDHCEIFAALLTVYERGDPIDLVAMSRALSARNRLAEVGGVNALVSLAESCGDTGNAAYYAGLVEEQYRRRQVMSLANQLRESAASQVEDIGETAARFASDVEQVGIGGNDAGYVDVRDVLREVPTARHLYVKTGLPRIDYLIGGFERSALTVIAGRTSVGKTALALYTAVEAVKAGETVLFVSVEMQRLLLARRLLSMVGDRSSYDIRDKMTPEDIAGLCRHVSAQLGSGHLYIADATYAIRDIAALAKAVVRRHQASIVVVDYLQLCKPTGKHDSRAREVGAMSKDLKRLALATKAAVVVPAQLNRDAANKPPTLANLRDSGEIEEDADVIWLLWRNEAKPDEPLACHIAKNRNGPTASVELHYDRKSQRFNCPHVGQQLPPYSAG